MEFSQAMNGLGQLTHELLPHLDAGLLVFARVLAFISLAPVFNRKDIAFNIKLALALFLTLSLMWLLPDTTPHAVVPPMRFFLLIVINIVIGAFIGFVGDVIMRTIAAAGSMMNAQIGLSSAMIFDPTTRTQVMVLDRLFAMIATVVFIQLGGLHWLILALKRTFTVFPLYQVNPHFPQHVDFGYLLAISDNVVMMATIMVAPVIVVTLSVDIMLGVVNRTAQQMPVFQLSFAMKPSIGAAVLFVTLPILLQVMINYLQDFAEIF